MHNDDLQVNRRLITSNHVSRGILIIRLSITLTAINSSTTFQIIISPSSVTKLKIALIIIILCRMCRYCKIVMIGQFIIKSAEVTFIRAEGATTTYR